MNRIFLNMNTVVLALVVGGLTSFSASASDFSPTDKAYQHYRCDALVELNRMTDTDQKVCDELFAGGFDMAAWEAENRDQSIKLREEVFSEFF